MIMVAIIVTRMPMHVAAIATLPIVVMVWLIAVNHVMMEIRLITIAVRTPVFYHYSSQTVAKLEELVQHKVNVIIHT